MFDLVVPARNEAANIQDALKRLVKAGELDTTFNIEHSTLNVEQGARNIEHSVLKIQSGTSDRERMKVEDGRGWKIIVAINGTTDPTLEKVEELRIANYPSQSLRTGELRDKIESIICPDVGKGAAIKYTAGLSKAEYFGFIDADLSADPEMILPMLDRVIKGECDIAIGSRLVNTKTTNRSWLRTFSSQLFNLLVRLILGLKIKDAQCGLKIMNSRAKQVLLNCFENGWFLDIEFLAKARQDGLRIIEIPVPWIEYRYANRISQIHMFKDGIEAIRALFRIRRRIGLCSSQAPDS